MDKNRASSLCFPGPSFDLKEVLVQATDHERKPCTTIRCKTNHVQPKGEKTVSCPRKPPPENNGPSLVLR